MAPRASAVDTDDLFIPIIDFSLFLDGTPDQKTATARAILSGFQSAGFIYLINHSIPQQTVSHTFSASAAFFDRPQSQKDALGWTAPEANRGYVAHGREKVSTLTTKEAVAAAKAAAPDLKESIEIGREGAPGLPNNWPAGDDAAGHFKDTMLAFHDRAKALHVSVMRAIAVGMGLEEGYFDPYTDVGDNTLRLLHYPPAPKAVFRRDALHVRAGEHTDYGSITLLFQDARGGLQVKSPKGTFVDATPVAGSVVVNAGDLLARWSNDTIQSTLHRVVEPPAPEESDVHPARYSIAYFCNPNFTSQIEAIEGTYGGDKGERKYEGINSGDYLVQRLTATY
ncbi:thymine dioxygenase [Diplocarpon rosae]|nr:thymine dioxygenase [Diplocarpon rosae]